MDIAGITALAVVVSGAIGTVFKVCITDRFRLLEGKIQGLEEERQVDRAVINSHQTFRRTVVVLSRQKDQVKSSAILELDETLEVELQAELEARRKAREKSDPCHV